MPLNNETCLSDGPDAAAAYGDTWDWWDGFRSSANYEKRIGVVLEVGSGTDE